MPAAYDEVITVSAFADFDGKPGGLALTDPCSSRDNDGDQDDTIYDLSNFGLDIDIAAPGVCIRSMRGLGPLSARYLTGTSAAAAHVSGAVALYAANNSGAGVKEIRNWLLNEASQPQDSVYGFTGDPDTAPGEHERVLLLPATG